MFYNKASAIANVYTYYSNYTDRYSTFIMNDTLDSKLSSEAKMVSLI